MEHPCEPCSDREIVYEEPESESEKEREAWYNDFYPVKRGRTKERNWGRTRSPSPSKTSSSGTDSDNSINDRKEALIQDRSLKIGQPGDSPNDNSSYVPPQNDNNTTEVINNIDPNTLVDTALDINVDQSHTELDTGVKNNVDQVRGTKIPYVYHPTPDRGSNFDSDAARKTLEKTLREMDMSSYGDSAEGKYNVGRAPNSQF
eukprot:CAMPEP_0195534146 /NCGR_PEP_ID=MMETSP0794_2-20130614/41889_1 /TAXON_ID=515487 /ORGANISM="Stephanopyxis turris, Strain CCMP 815" /LENGTH=202 /DNA_ID=CAMNT_0040666911 /DNA_START=159 /DNA_END=767 /DNA_ORIENTATION=-